jgi:3-polyprenyl-4-hydroxybenzoate decarboxylase
MLDHATSEMAIGSKLGIAATKNGMANPESFLSWPPLIRMDEAVKAKVGGFFSR